MPVARNDRESNVPNGVEALQYSIDFVTAIMLLTGRITTAGIFVVPEGFFLSATGPILGGDTFEGKTIETAIGTKSRQLDIGNLINSKCNPGDRTVRYEPTRFDCIQR